MTQQIFQPDAVTQIQQQIGCKLIKQTGNVLTFRLLKGPLRIDQYFSIKKLIGGAHGDITCNTIERNFHTVTVKVPIAL